MGAKKIIGIGNALMDVVVKLDNDRLLEMNNLPKGSMTLVDATFSASINEQTNGLEKIFAPGGSVANTVDGLAHLGVDAAFIGKVGNDDLGKSYSDGLKAIGAKPLLFTSSNRTGVAMALVSPDSERTFGTYLGAAVELSADDLTASLYQGYDIVFIEGYLVQNHDLIRKAAQLAKDAGLTVALDLASYNVVEANLDFLKEIMTDYVHIVFANEEEAKAFTGSSPEKAVIELGNLCDFAIVKTGPKGSLIRNNNSTIEIEAIESNCVDTTGAGDLYAAGFLYGYSRGLPLRICGEIASIIAGNVISVYGARMDEQRWNTIIEKLKTLY